jgi:hypothetical protein
MSQWQVAAYMVFQLLLLVLLHAGGAAGALEINSRIAADLSPDGYSCKHHGIIRICELGEYTM